MRKAAHPLGGVDSSNTGHQRGWRLHHHGGDDCYVFMLYDMVLLSGHHSLYVKKYRNITLR